MDVDASLPRETGHRVRDARKRRKLSRRRVATDAGFAAHELASVERGHRPLTIADLRSLAGSIGVEVSELLPDGTIIEDIPPPHEMRIEDLLWPSVESPDLEGAEEHNPYRLVAPGFVERRTVPIASARLNRAFAKLREHTEKVAESALVPRPPTHGRRRWASRESRSVRSQHSSTTAAFAACLAEYQRAREEYLRSTPLSSPNSAEWAGPSSSPMRGS